MEVQRKLGKDTGVWVCRKLGVLAVDSAENPSEVDLEAPYSVEHAVEMAQSWK